MGVDERWVEERSRVWMRRGVKRRLVHESGGNYRKAEWMRGKGERLDGCGCVGEMGEERGMLWECGWMEWLRWMVPGPSTPIYRIIIPRFLLQS